MSVHVAPVCAAIGHVEVLNRGSGRIVVLMPGYVRPAVRIVCSMFTL